MNKNYFFIFLFISVFAYSQNTTINRKNNEERELASNHKVMIIPFEPRLYMSEIDMQINQQTKLTSKQIKHEFRNGLSEQMYLALKNSNYNVLDLMEDTAKYRKDVEGIYQYLTYDYQKVPNQENYKAPEKEKREQKVQKGQLVIESNSDARFMNAKITNAKMVPTLYGHFKTDLFLFINQLEIKAAGAGSFDSYASEKSNRKIIVHYTIYSFDAKEINSGIAETEFDQEINNPKKIIDKYFSKIAETIVARLDKNLFGNQKQKK